MSFERTRGEQPHEQNEEMEVTSLAESMMEKDVPGGFAEMRTSIDFTSRGNSRKETETYVDRILEDEQAAQLLVEKMKTIKGQPKNLDRVKQNLMAHLTPVIDMVRGAAQKGTMTTEQAQDFVDKEFGNIFKKMTGEEYGPSDQEADIELTEAETVAFPEIDLKSVLKGKLPADRAAKDYVHAVLSQDAVRDELEAKGHDPKTIEASLAFQMRGYIETMAKNALDNVDPSPYMNSINETMTKKLNQFPKKKPGSQRRAA